MDPNELLALKAQLDRIERKLYGLTPDLQQQANVVQVRVFIDCSTKERKPFTFTFGGVLSGSINTSETRTAIFVILLLDLIKATENEDGIRDASLEIDRAYKELRGESASVNSEHGAVRVALYRFQRWLSENAITGEDHYLRIDDSQRLEVVRKDGTVVPPTLLDIELTASRSDLVQIINRVLSTSPLAQLERKRMLYTPSGNDGHDRLLFELFDHRLPM